MERWPLSTLLLLTITGRPWNLTITEPQFDKVHTWCGFKDIIFLQCKKEQDILQP